ncbi:MAG: FG-GAP-like repeat-containing protein [Pseudomonadota bacterium]
MAATFACGQVDGHCMLADTGGCTTGPVRDGTGILRPGTHVFYEQPTDRYGHGILGDAIEWGALTYIQQGSPNHGPYAQATYTLPQDRVFEDVAPRFADLDGDGSSEVIVVETQVDLGAQLAIYRFEPRADALIKVAATPHIGRTNRWLAPIGAADLDGDGRVEVAYIDRPHLAKTLRVWRFEDDDLTHVVDLPGLTNHRIGERDIAGGVRRCNGNLSLIVADATWSQVMQVTFDGRTIRGRPVARHTGRQSFAQALRCP